MAQELFANNATTTLASECDDVTTSATVVDASSFPATGNFRIKIDDEILLVTGVSGNVFTIVRAVEPSFIAVHPSGSTVELVLTAGSLRRATQEIGTGLTVTGDDSCAIGIANIASGIGCLAVGTGVYCTNDYSFAAGYAASSTGYAAAAIGVLCNANNYASMALGHSSVTRNNAAVYYSGGCAGAWSPGDSQSFQLNLWQETTDDTATALQNITNGSSQGYITMPDASTWTMQITCTGVDDAANVAVWDIMAIVQCDSEGGFSLVAYRYHTTANALTITTSLDPIAANVVSEFPGYLAISGYAANQVQLTVNNTAGDTTRWQCSLRVDELIVPTGGGGYGY